MHTIQIEQALFEIQSGVVGKSRAIARLVAATVVGGPIAVAGPPGVGKSHLINSMARVFGFELVEALEDTAVGALVDPSYLYVLDSELMDDAQLERLVDSLCKTVAANVIVTATNTDQTRLPSRLRDVLLGFVEIPYPSASEEVALALDSNRPRPVERILRIGDLAAMRSEALRLPVADSVVAYAVRLVQATRDPARYGVANLAPLLRAGASPRASIGLVRLARGLALVAGRAEVTHQDVYDASYEGLVHRMHLSRSAADGGVKAPDIVVELLSRVPAM